MEGIKMETASEMLFSSKIEIEEHGVKLNREKLDFWPADVRKVRWKLTECRVLVPKLLECNSCSFYTNNNAELETHMQTHQKLESRSNLSLSRISNYQCNWCDVKFVLPELLVWHIRNCHGPKSTAKVIKITDSICHYQCLLCQTVCTRLRKIIEHLRNQHETMSHNLPFQCQVCKKQFSRQSHLRDHQTYKKKAVHVPALKGQTKKSVIHDTKSSSCYIYNCQYCEQYFTSFQTLLAHYRKVHPSKPNLQCNICKSKFISYSGYSKHMQNHEGKEYPCNLCTAKFASPYVRNLHLKTVHSTKQDSCHICGAKFKCKMYLDRHFKKLHSQSTVCCEHCSYTASNKYNLFRHIQRRHLKSRN